MDPSKESKSRLGEAIENLFPGYFALVMATGIVSISGHLLGISAVAWPLVFINIAAYIVLVLLVSIRIVRFFPRVVADLGDHVRGPGFFTLVAGTGVLGSQLVIVAGQFQVAAVLWFVTLGLWVIVMYAFFTAITIKEHKPELVKGINGAWLISAVATQSVSVLGTLLGGHFTAYRELLLFFTLCMFLVGCMLYLILITLIFYRFTFLDLTSSSLTPPYWINMGAVAITTLAGARLILASGESKILGDILPFLKGFTLFFWASGSWWIPLLLILGAWRHIYKKFPLRYDPQYWGMVFPLGMYTTCTFQLSKAIEFEPLMLIPQVSVYFAIAAWIAAAGGLIYSLLPARSTAEPGGRLPTGCRSRSTMLAEKLLSRDHSEVDRLFADAFATLERGGDALDIIDLLWARLAVHIRAEHLHLFPAIRAEAEQKADHDTIETITKLREDHDFFMKGFASIVKNIRSGAHENLLEPLNGIARRLEAHNALEEKKIYPLVDEWLTDGEQGDLLQSIAAELVNVPPRFSAPKW